MPSDGKLHGHRAYQSGGMVDGEPLDDLSNDRITGMKEMNCYCWGLGDMKTFLAFIVFLIPLSSHAYLLEHELSEYNGELFVAGNQRHTYSDRAVWGKNVITQLV